MLDTIKNLLTRALKQRDAGLQAAKSNVRFSGLKSPVVHPYVSRSKYKPHQGPRADLGWRARQQGTDWIF